MSLPRSYKNPFAEYNANTIDAKDVLEYYCSPFTTLKNFSVSEEAVMRDANTIVFMGGRASGKTMVLRYWSYDIQKASFQQSEQQEGAPKTLVDHFNALGGIGFYIRVDGAALRSFQGFGVSSAQWDAIFTHFFELLVARSYLTTLGDLVVHSAKQMGKREMNAFLNDAGQLLGCDSRGNLEELLKFIAAGLERINDYRTHVVFKSCDFEEKRIYTGGELTFALAGLIKQHFTALDAKVNFVLLIEEYENFIISQQRVLNTLVKFVKPSVTFRIGMRLEGFRTFDTVTGDEFIKEGRDYQKVVFDEVLNAKDNGYQEYLQDIARKRLGRIACFGEVGRTDIKAILGEKEDPIKEANEIGSGAPVRIIKHYGRKLNGLKISDIPSGTNPLYVLLAALWVVRGKAPEVAIKALTDMATGEPSQESRAFKDDFTNKYKLSLVFLLCSIQRKDKTYYSFNTFSYLSSGIVGHFLELCRLTFKYAEFECPDILLTGQIPEKVQGMAATEMAIREVEQIRRIEEHGNRLYSFARHLGEIFRDYHRDDLIRYPETNQFSFDKSNLPGDYALAFAAAIRWSIVQRKTGLQQSTPGAGRTEVYTLNRIYSPEFQITYRTRGGISEEYESADIMKLMGEEKVKPKRNLSSTSGSTAGGQQALDM